jgi:cellulose synthase/poly-beta-1,6-N-acetylglucosamine synthase-like glycosyltransferase
MEFFSTIWQIVFWTSACLLIYTYIGYPLLVYLLSQVRPIITKRENIEPKVTILITAYNEERDIKTKLENTLQLDYPKDKLEILVASDGSTDNTDNIVLQFTAQGVRLFRQEGRVGKTITQNNAVEQSTGEIILFSDATTDYQPNVLREMLPNFADESVGCVAGKLIYVDKTKSTVGKGAKGYWNYETFLKESESRACSLIGASGCLYAVRKSAYVPMYAEACSDFLIATLIYEQGLRTIYEPNAVCEEETNRQSDKEFLMRVRVISQTFTDLWRNRRMLNPFRSGFYSIQLISHKVFRYAVPLFLLLTFISSIFLTPNSLFFGVALTLQIMFYTMAFVAWLAERLGKKLGVLAIPLYFVLANWASVVAFYRFLSGKTYARWEPIRESKENNAFGQSV